MNIQNSLKSQNSKLIWAFIVVNVVLLLLLTYLHNVINSEFIWTNTLLSKGVWILISPILVLIINGVLNSNQKASVCFWRDKHALPGCRAFSSYMSKDDRINENILIDKYKPLPHTPKDQNVLWFSIYRTHQNEPSVSKSHKDYLLSRDLCSIAFLFIFIAGIPGLFIIPFWMNWIYFSFLVVQYLILAKVTQNYGIRFVCNVLSIESSNES